MRDRRGARPYFQGISQVDQSSWTMQGVPLALPVFVEVAADFATFQTARIAGKLFQRVELWHAGHAVGISNCLAESIEQATVKQHWHSQWHTGHSKWVHAEGRREATC